MSTNLYMEPVLPTNGTSLSKGLKFLLGPKYFDHDGSLSGTAVLTRDDIPFLQGISVATSEVDTHKSADELIDALKQFGEVRIFIQ